MKTLLLLLALCVTVSSQAAVNPTTPPAEEVEEVAPMSSVKIKNDTGEKLSIHTGSGVVTLYDGRSTSIDCKPGTKIHLAERGMKRDHILTIKSSHCGETIELSDYID